MSGNAHPYHEIFRTGIWLKGAAIDLFDGVLVTLAVPAAELLL